MCGRDADRQAQAVAVLVLLGRARKQPNDPDAIRSHDERPLLTVRAEEGRTDGGRVARPELEDVARLDAARRAQRRPAPHTGIAVTRCGDVRDDIGGEVPAVVRVQEVVTLLIGPGDEIWRGRYEIVGDNGGAADPDRRTVARHRADLGYLLIRHRPEAGGADGVGELGLVKLVMAAALGVAIRSSGWAACPGGFGLTNEATCLFAA